MITTITNKPRDQMLVIGGVVRVLFLGWVSKWF